MDNDTLNPEVAAAFLLTWLRLITDGGNMSDAMEIDEETTELAINLVASFAKTSGLGPITTGAFQHCLDKMNISMTQGSGPAPAGGPLAGGHRFPQLCFRLKDGKFICNYV